VNPYMLRHTGAVWAAEQGIPMAEIAQMMGHDDSKTTEKYYSRFSPGYLRRVSDAIGSALNGNDVMLGGELREQREVNPRPVQEALRKGSQARAA